MILGGTSGGEEGGMPIVTKIEWRRSRWLVRGWGGTKM